MPMKQQQTRMMKIHFVTGSVECRLQRADVKSEIFMELHQSFGGAYGLNENLIELFDRRHLSFIHNGMSRTDREHQDVRESRQAIVRHQKAVWNQRQLLRNLMTKT